MNLLVGDRRIGGDFMFQDIEQLFDEINAKSNNYDNLKNIKNDDNSDDNSDDSSSVSSFSSLKNDKGSMDDLFDSLTSDVTGATSFINNIMDAKEDLNKEKKLFEEGKIKFD